MSVIENIKIFESMKMQGIRNEVSTVVEIVFFT